VFGVLEVIFPANAIAGGDLEFGKLQVLLVSVQQVLPGRRGSAFRASYMSVVHEHSSREARS
jgi:hypothetical protein